MSFFNNLSNVSRYYFLTLVLLILLWLFFLLFNLNYAYFCFFTLSFIWHFTLMMPGLKQQVMSRYHKLSFLSVIIRLDHYLHLFLPTQGNVFLSTVVRAISPNVFAIVLSSFSNNVSYVATLLGSFVFELYFYFLKKKGLYDNKNA